MLSEYKLKSLIYESKKLTEPVVILFHSPWTYQDAALADMFTSFNLPNSYLIDIFEQPELSPVFQLNRSPSLIVMNKQRFDIIDIPAAIIRELKYLNRANLSASRPA